MVTKIFNDFNLTYLCLSYIHLIKIYKFNHLGSKTNEFVKKLNYLFRF